MDRPFGRYLARVSAPKVLGIVLEEHRIQLLSEAVDIEILERFLFPLVENGLHIAEAHRHRRAYSHVFYGVELQRYGIVEELGIKEYTAQSVSAEHDAVDLFRVGTSGLYGRCTSQLDIVERHRALCREHLLPPLVDLGHLTEKAMSAHIHTVALIVNRTRDTAENVALLENGNVIILAFIQ